MGETRDRENRAREVGNEPLSFGVVGKWKLASLVITSTG